MKNKTLKGIAILLIATVAIVNVHVVMNSNRKNNFPIFLSIMDEFANGDLNTENTSNSGSKGPSTPYTKTCNTTTTTTTVTNSNNNNNSSWNANGNVSAGWLGGNVSVGGGYNSGNSTGSSSTTYQTTTTNCTSIRTGYDCPSQNNTSCTPYHPC
jgi:hypothetical protein